MKRIHSGPGRNQPAGGDQQADQPVNGKSSFTGETAKDAPRPIAVSREVMEKLRPADYDPDDPASV